MKNRVVYKAPVAPELNHPLRIAESGRKEHSSEPKQAIRSLFSNDKNSISFLFESFREQSHHVDQSRLREKSSRIVLRRLEIYLHRTNSFESNSDFLFFFTKTISPDRIKISNSLPTLGLFSLDRRSTRPTLVELNDAQTWTRLRRSVRFSFVDSSNIDFASTRSENNESVDLLTRFPYTDRDRPAQIVVFNEFRLDR